MNAPLTAQQTFALAEGGPEFEAHLRSVMAETLPRYFWARVKERGARVAMREKRLGIWRPITWDEYGERARAVGLGLVCLGLTRGEVVMTLSDNRPEWLYLDMGVMGVGGIHSGIYTTDSAKQVHYLLDDSESRFIIVENEEQLDKALAVRSHCPRLERIILIEDEDVRGLDDPMVMTFAQLLDAGRAYHAAHPDYWEMALAQGKSDDTAILIYTSGTTGPPKGAMISHVNGLFQLEVAGLILPQSRGGEQLSFLPLCHIAERNFTVFWPLKSSSVINFVESLETVPENVREVSPTLFFAVPRIWEKFYSSIALAMKDATWLGKLGYGLALKVGMARVNCLMAGRRLPLGLRLAVALADWAVFSNLRRIIGMDRVQYAISGAAPISPDLIKWLMAIGVSILEGYGQTENSALATITAQDRLKPGRVGRGIPYTEVRIGAEGEVLLKGPHIFKGYWKQPDKTAETIRDGWLHTGDVGEIDADGWLKITDRLKDIIITAGGKNITPSEIENQLKFSPFVSDAVVIGDKRKYLTCLIMIDYDNVAKFAQDKNIPFSNFASLCRAKEVQDLIGEEIERVNRDFARVESIKKFRLIETQLTAEDDELTPTMKLKRKFVNEKYKDLITSMYAGA